MNVNRNLWTAILFNIVFRESIGVKNKEWDNLLLVSGIENFKNYYSENCNNREVVINLSNIFDGINLSNNNGLERLFFSGWGKVDYKTKVDSYALGKKDTIYPLKGASKEYFISQIVEYPTVDDLYRFRKSISQENLQKALTVLFKSTKFRKHNLDNPNSKEDWWENHIDGNDPAKLMNLLELASLSKDSLEDWKRIGFFNDILQLRFDRLMNKNEDAIITTQSEEVYLITVSINNSSMLQKLSSINQSKLTLINKYIEEIFNSGIDGDLFNRESNGKKLSFLIKDKNKYETSIRNKDILAGWIENNIDKISEMVTGGEFKKTPWEIRDEAKLLVGKILLNSNLENNLEAKKTEKSHKI